MRRLVGFLCVVLLVGTVFSLGSIVFAQESPVYCGELSTEDCDILTRSSEAMTTLSSAEFDFEVNINVENMDTDNTTATIEIFGNGAFSSDMAGTGMFNFDATNPPEFSDVLEALRSFRGQLELTIVLPPEMIPEADTEGAGNGIDQIVLELRLIDGVGYINFDTLTAVFEALTGAEPPEAFTGWGGLDLADLLERLNEADPSAFNLEGMDPQVMALMGDASAFDGAVNITRDEGGEEGTASFTTTIDFQALAESEQYREVLRSQLEAQGETLSDEEFEEALDQLSMMGEALSLSSTTIIETETGYVRTVTFDMQFDTSMMQGMQDMEGMQSDENAAGQLITVTGELNYGSFNAAEEITAPEGAQIAPPELLFGPMVPPSPMEMTPTATPGS